MIICPNQRFVFVHIPKCAGTSIRSQIAKCDPDQISMGRVGLHDVLGTIDYGHIPLDQLRVHFPDTYAQLQELDTFAVVRDPLARFGSALRQVLWQYEKRPMTLIPQDELREMTLKMLDKVAGEIAAPSAPFIFFAPQSRFVFDEGRQITKTLIPVDMVPEFIAYLARRTGTEMETEVRANQNVELRVKGGLGKIAYGVNSALRTVLPGDLHGRIKDRALKVLAKDQSAAQASGVLDIPDVRAFVAEHYAEDTALFERVTAGREALTTALASGDLTAADLAAVDGVGGTPRP